METVKVGMREFRENLAAYLESDTRWRSCDTARLKQAKQCRQHRD
jgi:hypothetical protein